MTNVFLEKTTRHFRNALSQAFHHAALQGTKVVTPTHLLFALVCEHGSIGEEILRRAHVKREELARLLGEGEIITLHRSTILSPNAKRAIEKAVTRAAHDAHAYIGTEHLLYGILTIDSSDIHYLLQRLSIDRAHIEQQLEVALKSAGKLPELITNMWGATRVKKGVTATEKLAKQKTPALEYFGVELTAREYAQTIDPVIGRDAEIERVIHILARRTKNNPLLLGDPGVGKTAIVEGLAKRIAAGDVPPTLAGKRIFSIDLGLMVAGTMYRGEFEGRIKQLVEEVRAHPDIVLFIDEIHSLVGAGSSSGTLDAANLLKPALARGELHVIGATTFDEFKKHIEHDAALERRFQPITVNEPTAEETITIVEHVKDRYEAFHHIAVTSDAIASAVHLSAKYFPEKKFPDKAFDVLDEAMSAVKVQTARTDALVHETKLTDELKTLADRKQRAILKEDFEEAQRCKSVEQTVTAQLATLHDTAKHELPRATVQRHDVERVVSRMLRRPISELVERLDRTSFAQFLHARIFGQDQVIATVAATIAKTQLGLQNEKRPLASFLFVGPSGVGKTELAKLIAEGVYHDPHALIRIDMNELSEGFGVSKLLGAPAGYVGYRESNTLVDRVRHQPLSVILFDEIDKAHHDVLSVLLHMLEEGRITDAAGKEASVKQCIIILTYQIPLEEVRGSDFGFSELSSTTPTRSADDVRRSLFGIVRPELLNRIDHTLVFQPLDRTTLARIAEHELATIRERFATRAIALTWDAATTEAIAAASDDPREGARRVRTIIAEQIEKQLVDLVADAGDATKHQHYEVRENHGILSVVPLYGTDAEPVIAIRRFVPTGHKRTRSTTRQRSARHAGS